ncbi:XRE family transcriptional regulator [Streptomyces sp. NBC_01476]|uniref:XRE family transcriptional regulator n=1 Tax=Streptomyces sp. NBC_01476 TaxID=2903881 RepID=UPI002E2EB96F|nr:XRE family transcriptional regulator [Streptomyces sp. NBC_01476]
MAQRPKTGSKSERDSLRHEMLSGGFTLADIASEMRARFGFRPREAWRHTLGWSTQQAADRINEVATGRRDAVAADASLVGKWEKWPSAAGRRPGEKLLSLMAETYGCSVGQLLDLEDHRAMPARSMRPSQALTAEVSDPVSTHAQHPAPAAALNSPTGSEAVRRAAEESAAWAAWADPTNIGDIALEQLHADVRRLADEYLGGDAVSVFVRTRSLRDSVFRLLEGHQSPRQSAELYVVAGYACALLAWMSSDLGHLADADTHGRTAWLCGEKAGHQGLLAWTASTRSKIAIWDGRLRDAVNHARRGASYAAEGTVGALLACQEADAWSKIGAAAETEDALHRAESARSTVTGQDEIGGLFACSLGRQEQYHASAHLRTGKYEPALAEADSAQAHLQTQPQRAYGTEAQTAISQAIGHVGLGHPEAVMEVLVSVLQLRPEQRLDTVVSRMRELTAMMRHVPGSRGAESVRARAELTDWCQDSAPSRLALPSGSTFS